MPAAALCHRPATPVSGETLVLPTEATEIQKNNKKVPYSPRRKSIIGLLVGSGGGASVPRAGHELTPLSRHWANAWAPRARLVSARLVPVAVTLARAS